MALLKPRHKATLGELVTAMMDEASRVTPDSKEASGLATLAIKDLLVGSGNARTARKLARIGRSLAA